MRRAFRSTSLISACLAMSVATPMMAWNLQVGNCRSGLPSYPTISAAVSAAAPGATVDVCPGTYAEQVVITKPLTLQSVSAGNTTGATITVPPGGLAVSAISPVNGVFVLAQIFIEGTEAGLVNIRGLAVNGANNQATNGWVAGIYYQDSSGVVQDVAAYNQKGNGYGFGFFVDSSSSTPKTILVNNNSVHDFDAEGIRTNGNSNLCVDISSNSVIASNTLPGNHVSGGIDVDSGVDYQSAVGQVVNNKVIAAPGISASGGITAGSGVLIYKNTVIGWTLGIDVGSSNVVKFNNVSLSGVGVVVAGTKNDVERNRLFNLTNYGAGVDFNCTGTGNTVIDNDISDAYWGLYDVHGTNLTAPNKYSNVTKITSSSC